jgi:hypothetical protein
MTSPVIIPKYRVVTPTDEPYMLLWHEEAKLHLHLLGNPNKPIIAMDIKALPQIIERLVDIYNDLHPDSTIKSEREIIVEEPPYEPQTPGMGTF